MRLSPHFLFIGLGLLLSLNCVTPNTAHAQTAIASQEFAPQLQKDLIFLAWQGNQDVQACGVCHYAPGNEFAKRNTEFCRLTEIQQWLQSDKHAIARQRVEPIAAKDLDRAVQRITQVLRARGAAADVPKNWIGPSNHLSHSICEKLGYAIETDEGYARFRENCLTCHGGYEPGENPSAFARHGDNHPGITCNDCHQNGSNRSWIDQHSSLTAAENWRLLVPEKKADAGMRNLTTAKAQAELCFRCHVGDMERNAYVTHAMYVAGHPPLPSVELSTLVKAMPGHWRDNRELFQSMQNSPGREAYFKLNFQEELANLADVSADRVFWNSSQMLSGAIAAEQQWLKLVSQACAPDSKYFGDYGLYDCSACHHSLRSPSDRQRLRSGGAPGRPRLVEWTHAVSDAALLTLRQDATIGAFRGKLSHAVSSRPFGHRATMGAAAQELSQALDSTKSAITSSSTDPNFFKKAMKSLCQTSDEQLLDYHSARQINWAIRCIDAELATMNQSLPPQVRQAIADLGTGPEPKSIGVSTSLPKGIQAEIYPSFVREELQRQTDYDPKQFKRQLQAIEASGL